MPRLGAATCLTLLALSVAPAARAAAFRDEATGFSLDPAVPGATVCFIRPRALGDPAGCKGIDVAALEGGLSAPNRLDAAVRFADWAYVVEGTFQPRQSQGPMLRRNVADFVHGIVMSSGEFQLLERDPDLLVVNGLQALRFTLAAGEGAAATRLLFYVVLGRDTEVFVSFLTDAAHLDRVRPLAERTMRTVAMPPVTVPASWDGAPAGRPHGVVAWSARIGGWVYEVGFAVLLCGAAVLVYRAVRRRR